jgi:hypothetical protein
MQQQAVHACTHASAPTHGWSQHERPAPTHPRAAHHNRRRCWLGRLFIEDAGVGFASFQWAPSASQQQPADPAPQYRFLRPSCPEAFLHIRLDGMGPKLLVSDLSTADQPLLRWRLVVRGNTAVEFGVVPLCLVVSWGGAQGGC